MILKFVTYPYGEVKTMHERVLEVDDFSMGYDSEDQVMFYSIDKDGLVAKSVAVDCKSTCVYVMSDSGKTIDSYKWKEVCSGGTNEPTTSKIIRL